MALAASLTLCSSSCICFDFDDAYFSFSNSNSNTNKYKYKSIHGDAKPSRLLPLPLTPNPNKNSNSLLLQVFSTSTLAFVGLGLCLCSSASALALNPLPQPCHSLQVQVQDERQEEKDEKLEAAFETWKSKSFALSVPLSILALQGSIPPSWPKDFIFSQSRRLKLQTKFHPTLEDIFSRLCTPFTKPSGNIGPASAVAADIVTLGDSWLPQAIRKAIIEPIPAAEHQDWFKDLGHKWKIYLRRNLNGDIDPQGQIWAAPYRWGTMVIAYKKTKFQKHKLPPIQRLCLP